MEPGKIYITTDKVSLSRLDIRPVYDPKSRCYYSDVGNEYRYLESGDYVVCVDINPTTSSVKVIYGDFVGWVDIFYLKRFKVAEGVDRESHMG